MKTTKPSGPPVYRTLDTTSGLEPLFVTQSHRRVDINWKINWVDPIKFEKHDDYLLRFMPILSISSQDKRLRRRIVYDWSMDLRDPQMMVGIAIGQRRHTWELDKTRAVGRERWKREYPQCKKKFGLGRGTSQTSTPKIIAIYLDDVYYIGMNTFRRTRSGRMSCKIFDPQTPRPTSSKAKTDTLFIYKIEKAVKSFMKKRV